MIGKRMSDKLLEGQKLKFYEWEGDVKVRIYNHTHVLDLKRLRKLMLHNCWYAHVLNNAYLHMELTYVRVNQYRCSSHLIPFTINFTKEHLDGVRIEIDKMAVTWSVEEKEACLQETLSCFKYGSALMVYIR